MRQQTRRNSSRFKHRLVRGATRLGFAICLAAMGLAVTAESASAATCYNYKYAGYTSGNGYQGIERYISIPSSTLQSYSQQHVLFWNGLNDYNKALCPNWATPGQSPQYICWVQGGTQLGNVDNQTYTGVIAYFETSSPNNAGGYHYYPFPQYSLSQDTFFTLYYNGQTFDGYALYTGYIKVSSGATDFLQEGELADGQGSIESNAEVYSSTGSCPALSRSGYYQYFGTNGGGGTNSGYELEATTSVPNSWSPWTSGSQIPTSKNAPYNSSPIVSSAAFQTWG
jgi:hypothetical protein